MKAPDAALVRARAKAPLTDLQVLHLSHADLSCLRNLEACRQLRSLYAGGNVLKDIDGISALRRLWRIDLSGNLLRQLRPLASFPALGFLNVERNQLRFEDLVCLHDVHILDLRLYGNRDLLGQDHDRAALIEYRMRIVALLPYVWSLDGHFVTLRERVQALETFDDLTLQLLGRHSEGQVSSLRFGSSSDVWGSALVAGDDLNSPVQEDTLKLLQVIEKQPTRNPEKQDLHRLRALSMFYDAESDVHNAYTQFGPQKHAACGKPQPKVHLARFQRLASRVQLEVCVLLAAHLEFRLPAKLLAEAVTIATLGEDELQATSWIEDLAQLPPYAIVALLSVVRSHMLEQLTATHRNQTTAEFAKPFDVQMWKSMPAIATTLLGSDRQRLVVEADTPDRLYVQRCAFAVSLLSRATLFPERPFADTARNDLVDLINVAKLARASSLESFEFTIPRVLVVDDDSTAGNIQKMSFRNPEREYRRPWSEKPPAAVHSPPDSEPPSQPTRRRRAPRPGEWLELRPKLHLKIRSVSVDGTFISAAGVSGTELSQLVTIRTDQIARISSSMWRLADDDPVLLDNCMRHLGMPTNMKRGRLGKLHRDSEAFHKHGAMRNQGYPNRDVTTHDLQCIAGREEDRTVNTSRQLQPVEVFSSTDTLDSNYVLTSPALISVQNAVATKAFHQQRQNPAGLWNPIQTASFQVLPSSDEPENNVALEKMHKPKSKPALPPEHNGDDWLELQKDMQALLGMRPRTPKASIDDTDCFMTSVPPNDPLEDGVTRDTPDDSANSPVGLSHAASSPSLISQPMSPVQSIPRSTAKPKKLAAISWRQVPTKPQLLVASSGVSASPQAAKLGHGLPTGLSDPSTEAPDISLSPRPWSSSSRAPVRLTRCQVSLPTLALLGTNQK